jgi:hypothetical protein
VTALASRARQTDMPIEMAMAANPPEEAIAPPSRKIDGA